MWLSYNNENGNKVDNGFIIFNTYRIDDHFKFFKDRFIEPAPGIASVPYYIKKMPDGFKRRR